MTDAQLPIAQAFIAYLDPLVSSLSLKQHAVDPSTARHPNYPVDPVADCPKLLLRAYKADLKGHPNAQVEWKWFFSYWYYKQIQLPPANAQELLMADIATIENAFLGNFAPELIKAAGADFVMPLQAVIHEELEHPLGEPRLRVLVAEILFGVEVWA